MIVLITGASGGFGQVLGTFLAGKGLTVYGTMRAPENLTAGLPFTMLAMDVTDEASVSSCIQDVLSREGHIDVVVNCVNEMVIGSVEETSMAELQSVYTTNVLGVAEICKAVLPSMRARRKGTIINMSSLGGLLAVPLMSAYTSSKFALEAMSEALYHEVKPDNIDVVIMQPVAMHMDRPAIGGHLKLVGGVTQDSRSHKMVERMAKDTVASKLTPEMVAEKIYAVMQKDRKPLRVPMDKAKAVTLAKRFAPQTVIDKLVNGLI